MGKGELARMRLRGRPLWTFIHRGASFEVWKFTLKVPYAGGSNPSTAHAVPLPLQGRLGSLAPLQGVRTPGKQSGGLFYPKGHRSVSTGHFVRGACVTPGRPWNVGAERRLRGYAPADIYYNYQEATV